MPVQSLAQPLHNRGAQHMEATCSACTVQARAVLGSFCSSSGRVPRSHCIAVTPRTHPVACSGLPQRRALQQNLSLCSCVAAPSSGQESRGRPSTAPTWRAHAAALLRAGGQPQPDGPFEAVWVNHLRSTSAQRTVSSHVQHPARKPGSMNRTGQFPASRRTEERSSAHPCTTSLYAGGCRVPVTPGPFEESAPAQPPPGAWLWSA